MCNCEALPDCVLDLDTVRPRFDFPGAKLFPACFKDLDADQFEPPLRFGETAYRCASCGTLWHAEVGADQTPFVTFAMKHTGEGAPTREAIQAAKQWLVILAHDGFGPERCRQRGCPNHQLKGRALCHLHLG